MPLPEGGENVAPCPVVVLAGMSVDVLKGREMAWEGNSIMLVVILEGLRG